jgi:hypothetical protein
MFIPHSGKEEDDDRAAYYGGRVMCQRKEYFSKDFDNEEGYTYFDEIKDYLVIADVNSLYPSVQVSCQYAYGKWKYLENPDSFRADLMLIRDESWIKRCAFKVNARCPQDLITSFLMRRVDGKLHHSLAPITEQWYWGPELIEAIILGYVVELVHEIKEFELFGDIFGEYVRKCWQGRLDNPKPSVKNLAYKNAMNCLTGKFGQKSHETSTSIFSTTYKPSKRTAKDFEKMLTNVVDFTPIFSDDGFSAAVILETTNANTNPAYPIYLSAQILANSRVHMSRIMRACNAYLDPKRAIYYTDTDSLVIPSLCLPDLEKGNYIGNGLGQMSCDLGGFKNNKFAKIVKAVWAAVKGPYSLVYVDPEKPDTIMEKVRVKGIPHRFSNFPHLEEVEWAPDSDTLDKFNQTMKWVKQPMLYKVPPNIISQRFYVFISRENPNDITFVKHINYNLIKKMMGKEGDLYSFYGGMKREVISSNGNFLDVKVLLLILFNTN